MTEDQRQPICCGNCPFFARQANAQNIGSVQGFCRRYPPQVSVVPVPSPQRGKVQMPGVNAISMSIRGDFPPVDAKAVCGEHPGIRQAVTQMKTEDKTNGHPTQV